MSSLEQEVLRDHQAILEDGRVVSDPVRQTPPFELREEPELT
jgi:hypothetical protein